MHFAKTGLFMKGRRFIVQQGSLAYARGKSLSVASLCVTGFRPPQEQVNVMFRYFFAKQSPNLNI